MFLWIDPGIRKVWYALIDSDLTVHDAGILVDEHHDVRDRFHQYERMSQIFLWFNDFLIQYPAIQSIGIEKLFFTSYNQQNAEFVYGMRGIVCTICHQHNIIINEYTPPELKRRITGNGKAGKELVQRMIMKYFNLENIPQYHDAADALWLAFLASRNQ